MRSNCKDCCSDEKRDYSHKNKTTILVKNTEYRRKNYEKLKEKSKTADAINYRSENLLHLRALRNHFRARERFMLAPWYDFEKAQAFYDDAQVLTEIFGWQFDVDHIIPVKCADATGFHCSENLQILTKRQNLSKRNKLLDAPHYQTHDIVKFLTLLGDDKP
jgi:hypothetical protein